MSTTSRAGREEKEEQPKKMNAFTSLFEQTTAQGADETSAPELEASSAVEASICEPNDLALEQIRSLVRQVFLPGWPKAARQVLFSAVDETTDVSAICQQVGQALAAQVSGTACIVDANLHHNGRERKSGLDLVYSPPGAGGLRDASHQLCDNLWHVPLDVFLGLDENGFSAAYVRRRLADLSLEFDYIVIQGPAAGLHSEAALLGHLCDGVVLVVEANFTRRLAAQKVKESLCRAKVRLLGAVLTERTFPIPEEIYKRL